MSFDMKYIDADKLLEELDTNRKTCLIGQNEFKTDDPELAAFYEGEEVNVVEWTKEHSAELLSLAREQLEQEIKEEVLKDLPRWKKCDGYWDGTYVTLKGANPVLIVHGKILSLEDLMKLPGFKED